MNETLLNNGWKSKTVRVKNDYHKVCTFLLYKFNQGFGVDKSLFDNILNFSLDYLDKNGFEFEMNNFQGRRYPKGFLVTDETLDRISEYYSKAKVVFKKKDINLSVGEFYELLLFIYCKLNIGEDMFNMLDLEWGFSMKDNDDIL